jgi:U4/U6.U5 tri-snRNP component SNU23
MSTNLKYKQVVNVTRRTWDVEAYEKRAQDRATNASAHTDEKREAVGAAGDQVGGDGNSEEEFIPAASGAMGPLSSKRAFLKARTNKIKSLDSKIGSVEIVNPEAVATSKSVVSDGALVNKDSAVTKSGVGWHCKVCDCFLKDSLTYLDHINGRKHQRNLGFSMRVERSTKDQVVSRLEGMVKEKERCSKATGMDRFEEDEEEEDFNEIVKAKDEELKRRKEERKRERKERRRKKKEHQTASAETGSDKAIKRSDEKEQVILEEANEESNSGGLDPNIAAMMGFSGFGGGNKNR